MARKIRRILFICTGNIDRSPTAEALLKEKPGFDVQSAGTSLLAPKRLSRKLVDWADIIFAMEERHRMAVLAFNRQAGDKVIVLNVPDIYKRGDLELMETLKTKLSDFLGIVW